MATVDDIVDFALNDDASSLKTAMDEIMNDRIETAIDNRKLDLVNRLFNKQEEEEEQDAD